MFIFNHLFMLEVFTAKVMTTLPGILSTRATLVFFHSWNIPSLLPPRNAVFSAVKYCHSSLHLLQFFIYIYSTFTSQFKSLPQTTLISFLSPILSMYHQTVHNCCIYLSCIFFIYLCNFINVHHLSHSLNSKIISPSLFVLTTIFPSAYSTVTGTN